MEDVARGMAYTIKPVSSYPMSVNFKKINLSAKSLKEGFFFEKLFYEELVSLSTPSFSMLK